MRRMLCIGVLGMSAVFSAMGQGHVLFSNYLTAPYNQVRWPHPSPVNDLTMQIQIWWGEGVISNPDLLNPGIITAINPALRTQPGVYGPGGWFYGVAQLLPTWNEEDIFTFQLRAYLPNVRLVGTSMLWTEQSSIVATSTPAGVTQTLPPLVIIPEPSVLYMMTWGLALLWGRHPFRSEQRASDSI
jgi:hypothetical protein